MSNRIPPHDLDAERSLLASMLTSVSGHDAALQHRITGPDFYLPAHRMIYDAMRTLDDQMEPTDPVTTCAKLESGGKLAAVGGRDYVTGLLIESTVHPNHYAAIVAAYARSRRYIRGSELVGEAAYTGDQDQLTDQVAAFDALKSDGALVLEPPPRASELALQEVTFSWVIPNVLARQETVLLVAEGGAGKTTLMRQIAACAGSGLNPFTRVPMKPVRSLTFDFQDPPGPAIRETRKMIECAGDSFRDLWWVELRREGVDLTSPRDQAWFEGKIASVEPDLVLCGPVYNMVRGAPGRSATSEDSVALATQFLVQIMVKYDLAIIAEAHAPHGSNPGAEMRVRGSKLWEDWAAFGFGLIDESETVDAGGQRRLRIERFRGDREMGRLWPRTFVAGHGRWPWDCLGIADRPSDEYPDEPLGF